MASFNIDPWLDSWVYDGLLDSSGVIHRVSQSRSMKNWALKTGDSSNLLLVGFGDFHGENPTTGTIPCPNQLFRTAKNYPLNDGKQTKHNTKRSPPGIKRGWKNHEKSLIIHGRFQGTIYYKWLDFPLPPWPEGKVLAVGQSCKVSIQASTA